MGYREGALNFEKAEPKVKVDPPQSKKSQPKSEAKPTSAGYSIFGWFMMAGVPILIAGGIILMLGRKRES